MFEDKGKILNIGNTCVSMIGNLYFCERSDIYDSRFNDFAKIFRKTCTSSVFIRSFAFSSIETIVVIPALMEDHLESCLLSLAENEDIDFSKLAVICLLNYKEHYAEERHVQKFYESQLKALTALQSTLPYTLGILGPMELKVKMQV